MFTPLYPNDLVTFPGRSAHHSLGVVGGMVDGSVNTNDVAEGTVVVVVVMHASLMYQKSWSCDPERSPSLCAELEKSRHVNFDWLKVNEEQ